MLLPATELPANLRGFYTNPRLDVLDKPTPMKSRSLWILLVLVAASGGFGLKIWRDSVVDSRAREAEMRVENERAAAEAEIKKLQRTIREQEDLVEDLGKVIKTIIKTKAMVFDQSTVVDADWDDLPVDPRDQETEDRYAKLDEESTRLKLCLAHFLYLEEAPLMTYADGLDLPDNPVKLTFPAYLDALRGREELRNKRLNEQRPEFQAAIHKLNDARTKTREAVADLKTGLQAQHETAEQQSKTAGEHLKRAVMFNAQTRFEAEQEILQLMRGKLAHLEERQTMDLKQPPNH